MDRQDTAAMAEMMATLNASNTSLQETVKVLTTLVASMQQREQRLREVVAEQLQVLQHAASSADAKVNRVLESALPRLTQLTNQALTQTLEPAAKRFNKEMAHADAELKAIFDPVEFPAWASKYPHRWFGPILGLYSGARVNEIAQLRLDDIDTIDGVPGFFVRQGGKGQSVKNKNSRRFVPLAQPVIDCGFLDYVEEARQAGVERLFPDLPNSTGLGYGRQLSRQFSVYIKRQGVSEKGQGFHGFRHTIASKLDEAGVSASAIGALTGHGTGQTVLEKFYIDRRSLPDRVATLAKLNKLPVLPIYEPSQFRDNLNQANR